MEKRILFTILSLFLAVGQIFAQAQGELRGRIIDRDTKEPLPFANIVVEMNGMQRGGTTTDIDGYYIIRPLPPGTYDVRAIYMGYDQQLISGVVIYGNQIRQLNVELTSGIVLDEVVVREQIWEKPLIEFDGGLGEKVTSTEISQMPTRNINTIIATVGGATTSGENDLHIKGGRANSNVTYIDGIRVTGNMSLPQGSIEQLEVITGGVPAEYGDAIGGVINIITKGPSAQFRGGVEAITSEAFDAYGYNVVEANISGPLAFRDRETKESSILGFFLAGTVNSQRDQRPSPVGAWRIREDRLDFIQQNPLSPAPSGQGFVPNAEFIGMDDLENVAARQNVGIFSTNLSGKVDYQPHRNVNITAGGQFGHQMQKQFIPSYALFNFNNNPTIQRDNYRGYFRFSQNFRPAEGEQDRGSRIQNAYYTIQADYSNNNVSRYDENHRDNLFDYGHLGTYEVYKIPTFKMDPNSRISYQNSYTDTLVVFTPSNKNPITQNYTTQYFNYEGGRVRNFTQLREGGALLNGGSPQIIYSLWQNAGTPWNSFYQLQQSQFNLSAIASGSIDNHALRFGVQFEQRNQRYFNINATGLWGQMRQLMNDHIGLVDVNNPIYVYDDKGMFQDTIRYQTLVNKETQSAFDRNFREYLMSIGATDVYGNLIDEHSLVNIDRYDPSMFNLGMFSADELIRYGDGGSATNFNYYGYTHDGQKLRGRPSIEDFIDPTKRHIGAYNPIYVAGFIEDKFAFRDLVFRLGLRVDRFDANQAVLADRYSFFPTRSVGMTSNEFNHPSHMGEDFVVYVDDTYSPTKQVVGYRNNETWYDANGVEIIDPLILANRSSTGRITPYLQAESRDDEVLDASSFRDYTPSVNFMPRISFSFPISEDAAFFANYDVLTQRPSTGNIGTYDDYFRIQQRSTSAINNPNLRPERRTNYEIGFKQKISFNSAITIQAFYGEIKDMVQRVKVYQAYPIDYTTFGNVDFGTVKGFSLGYDMRRNPRTNIGMRLNYTLQFADGTGSDANSAANLVSAGMPNLLVPVPLSYDVRHNIVSVIDFRFRGGEMYNGPVWNDRQILRNTGLNLLLNASSGEPYTKQSNVTQEVSIGIRQSTTLDGGIHGSRLPWQFRADLKLDRDFPLTFGSTTNEQGQTVRTNPAHLNVYLWVSNLFNTRNVIRVYNYTGSPSDDGYLTSVQGRQDIARMTDPAAYHAQYSVKVNNPSNYALPRLIRLGAVFNF